ncbi:MAG: DUF2227 family putative metal-binding protein [Chloroflexi bacterium]|nr:DUF2227 family putative metal-binding protein [Chloroflexota bacterium]
MPGFWGHTITNSIALVGVTAYMAAERWSVPDIAAVDAGILLSTFVLSPDMDLFTSKPMEEWGWLRFFWWPYARIVKHRDRLHTPILGTTARWIYLIAVITVLILPILFLLRQIGLQVNFSFNGSREDVVYYFLYVVDIFVGANIADGLHFGLDMITHGLKHGTPQSRVRRNPFKRGDD